MSQFASPPGASGARFSDDLLYAAAHMYYSEDATQAQVAEELGMSRATVSRLLAEARAHGIVTIEVHRPTTFDASGLAGDLTQALGINRAWIGHGSSVVHAGRALAPQVGQALEAAELHFGDALLVSSGASVYEASRSEVPTLPGVVVAPTVGGMYEPDAYYQTNEIVRRMAMKVQGNAEFLYAPAMPGPELAPMLRNDPTIRRVTALWDTASVALLGIGAAPRLRTSLPSVISKDRNTMANSVGDICTRPFDRDGEPIVFPGMEDLVAMDFDQLRRVPHAIAIAAGADKVASIRAAAKASLFNELVTDAETAQALLEDA